MSFRKTNDYAGWMKHRARNGNLLFRGGTRIFLIQTGSCKTCGRLLDPPQPPSLGPLGTWVTDEHGTRDRSKWTIRFEPPVSV